MGRPNVGKSTLLNALLKHKVAAVSSKPQTTRSQIMAYHEDERGQLFFLDTPGYYLSKGKAENFNTLAKSAVQEADLVLYVVDQTRPWGREDELIWHVVEQAAKPTILAINKLDRTSKDHSEDYIDLLTDSVAQVLRISAEQQTHIKAVLNGLYELAQEGKRDDSVDQFVTPLLSQSAEQYIAELIREKLYHHLSQELPYQVSVEVLSIDADKEDELYLDAVIHTTNPRHKAMVIGAKGQKITQVKKSLARELNIATSKKPHIRLRVD